MQISDESVLNHLDWFVYLAGGRDTVCGTLHKNGRFAISIIRLATSCIVDKLITTFFSFFDIKNVKNYHHVERNRNTSRFFVFTDQRVFRCKRMYLREIR